MTTWVKRWHDVISSEPVMQGVWRRRDGGFLVRARVKDPRTGVLREVKRRLPDLTRPKDALVVLEAELAKIRDGAAAPGSMPTFAEAAATVFERKIALGRIVSAAGRKKWQWALEEHLIPAFGPIYVDRFSPLDVKAWQTKFAARIAAGEATPGTGNTVLAVLQQIANEIANDFDVRDPMRGVAPFDMRSHRTYTEESPNSLKPADVPRFLVEMRRLYPEFYAFVFLGFTTGQRPSHLRPLRARGAHADIDWESGRMIVRRSQTHGAEVMDITKTARDLVIYLDPEQLKILRWHLERLEGENVRREKRYPKVAAAQRASELLFPARPTRHGGGGGFMSASCLVKPFRAVAEAIGIKYKVSPRAMRRTFQDLARAANVSDIVTRAISGHATESMQRHYSTVDGAEVRSGLAKVIDIATGRELAA